MLPVKELVTQEDLNAILCSIAPDSEVDDEYEHFVQPDYEAVKALAEKYWDSSFMTYGENAPDFPLCYDFAELCEAALRKGAVQDGLKARLAFGTLRYTKNSGLRHAICFVVTSECQIKYFEPQMVDKNRWSDEPDDVKSLDAFYI